MYMVNKDPYDFLIRTITGYFERFDLSEKVVEISDLSFTWPGSSAPAVELPQLVVQAKEHLFIRGASGSGKSTLLGLLAGVLTATRGSVDVLGRNLSEMSASGRDRFRADHMGYIFQQFNLVPYLSVIDNVTLPLRYSSSRSAQIAQPKQEAVRLLEHLGMEPFIDRRAVELSVGQQQRVAAARALIGKPALVIADEPTSALDADNRESFIRLLFQECEKGGATLVLVSHDAALGASFNQVVELGSGA